jgi:hypothetical protein
MADVKITALAPIGANPVNPATFPIPMVDLLDNSMAASGTTKKVTVNQILGSGGTATLASATITGDLTVDTSTLKVDSANDNVGIGTTTPASYAFNDPAKLVIANTGTAGAGNTFTIASGSTGFGNLAFANGTSGTARYNGYIAYNHSSNFMAFYTNAGAERYRLGSDGTATWSVGGSTAMTLDSTGLLVGTTSANGSASNSVKNVGGVFSTVNGATGSIATGVAATLFTAPSEAVFIVSAYIVGSASPANYNAVAIVRVSGGTAAITTISTASNLTISLSGLNVQATQTSGINQAFAYSAIRIS